MTQAEVAKQPVVSVENLHVRFVMRDATVAAVNGVSFTLEAGQVLGILGESGSGKSVTLRALMRLLPPARTRIEGRVRVAGHEIAAMDEAALREVRGTEIAMIFQEPMIACSPSARRSPRRSCGTKACPTTLPIGARSSCWKWSRSRRPPGG